MEPTSWVHALRSDDLVEGPDRGERGELAGVLAERAEGPGRREQSEQVHGRASGVASGAELSEG
jgi:hypothetical protein